MTPAAHNIHTICISICISAFLFIPGCSGGKKNVAVQPVIENTDTTPQFAIRYRDPAINLIIHTAWEHYNSGRYEPALLDFERLIVKGYNHYDVLFGAGMSSLKYYDMNKAVRYLSMCITAYPGHFEALFYRSEAYRLLKHYKQARTDLESILAADPSAPFICGLYPSEYTDRGTLKRRKEEAKNLLKTL